MFELPRPPKIDLKSINTKLWMFKNKSKSNDFKRNSGAKSGSVASNHSFLQIVGFLLLIAIVQLVDTPSPLWAFLAMTGILFVGFIVFVKVKSRLIAFRWLDGVEMKAIDEMPGHEFEQTCAEIYRRLGYSVKVTQRTRDQGADLIMEGAKGRVVVQAKRQASSVGNWAVQEICAAKGLYKAVHAIVITNNTYTVQAIELAKANAVELIDRKILAEMLAKVVNPAARVDKTNKSNNP